MNSTLNEKYSDEYQNENETIELIHQLSDNDKLKTENINNLEDLLIKSRRLNTLKSVRFINENLDKLLINKRKSIKNLTLSCNQFGLKTDFNWNELPKNLKSLDLSGNFLSSIDGTEYENNELESLSISFNQLNQSNDLYLLTKWPNLCLIDLSYNNLNNLNETIKSLKNLSKLRILYLHGNPLSLLIDYRIYVVDSLNKLIVLDDIRITAEERIRSRNYSQSERIDKNYSSFQISFKNIENVPPPIPSQNEWPIEVHRYKMSLDWFEESKENIEINFDLMSNFKRFDKSLIETSLSEYKTTMEFPTIPLNLTNDQLLQFRDFLFNGTKCRFIHQMTEYWPPEAINQTNEKEKNKSNSSRDKKTESPVKKKKTEDLSKLITLKNPTETVLAEFNVDLRPFLDGDYQVLFNYKSILEQQILSLNQQETVPMKSGKQKDFDKNDSNKDKKRTSAVKLNQEKSKDQQKDKKIINENENESDKINQIQPFQCSIQFQLQHFITQEQFI